MDKIVAMREEMVRQSMENNGELCTCDCGKPKFPLTSNKQIRSISSEQTRGTKILEKRESIIDVLQNTQRSLNIMEVGVMAGDFAELMYNNLKINKMVLVDPFNNIDEMSLDGNRRFNRETNLEFVKQRFQNKNNVEILQGYSRKVLPTNFLGTNNNDKFDFIYIDSNHEFFNTYNEILYSAQLTKTTGIIGIDDYTLSLNDPLYVCEVMQAVTQFLDTNRDWKVAYYSFNDAGIPNIYLSRYFEDEHPWQDSNLRPTP